MKNPGEYTMSFARNLRSGLLALTALTAIGATAGGPALAQQPQKPNILVIKAKPELRPEINNRGVFDLKGIGHEI